MIYGALPLKPFWGDGKMAIINGVGYPNPNCSHFRSMDIWYTCEPEKMATIIVVAPASVAGRILDPVVNGLCELGASILIKDGPRAVVRGSIGLPLDDLAGSAVAGADHPAASTADTSFASAGLSEPAESNPENCETR